MTSMVNQVLNQIAPAGGWATPRGVMTAVLAASLLVAATAAADEPVDRAENRPAAQTDTANSADDGAPRNEPTETDPQNADDRESDTPSLDDLLGIDEEEQDRSADTAAQRDHEDELERLLSEERLADGFAEAIAKMTLSAELLDERFDTGLGTQRVQDEIIAKLSELIDEAQQQQSSGGSGASSASASPQPQQDPGEQGGGGQPSPGDGENGSGDAETDLPAAQEADIDVLMEEMREEWGSLPDRVRDMLLQGRQERFSGLYEHLTREYYRRLAED